MVKLLQSKRKDLKKVDQKKYTSKQIDNALSMLSINGGKYSYTEVAGITSISKSTLIRENNKRKVSVEEVM